MDEWGVDVCVSGSQKGFMMPPGLGILGVSKKALKASETATMRRASARYSLNFEARSGPAAFSMAPRRKG